MFVSMMFCRMLTVLVFSKLGVCSTLLIRGSIEEGTCTLRNWGRRAIMDGNRARRNFTLSSAFQHCGALDWDRRLGFGAARGLSICESGSSGGIA